jgi:transcription initiation factor IIF auxiliary subunit
MPLKIKQDFEYKGDDWWEWELWIEAPKAELDQIDRVVYRLHPTFPEPVRTVKDRGTKFKLVTGGWGMFQIKADVFLKSGKSMPLQHDLVLKYPDGKPTKK